jgi:hypothetical protein
MISPPPHEGVRPLHGWGGGWVVLVGVNYPDHHLTPYFIGLVRVVRVVLVITYKKNKRRKRGGPEGDVVYNRD